MAGLPRPAAVVAPAKKQHSMRPPPRPPASRPQSTMPPSQRPDRSRAASPTESIASTTNGGTKRKERDFEQEGGETNINVVVRCRGRNERELRENSGVVLNTDGVRGKSIELSMGPSALSNKTYHFDKVFSSAADQAMLYDEVVTPILGEMLSGFNCTIFAYGQTGTGKTYTMSGDMNDTLGMLSDAAGIIPRVLYALFNKLELDDAESSVKCSFIELYNEELRDLVSTEENVKLKIFEDNSKRGHATTVVQGMEEAHIKSAVDGVKLLQRGSLKRQVAATKCNDLSSRSHTVFTVTAYIKRTGDNGEDYVSAGKLNLVDLAGSENIQRSGAENKRAAEAGLINKSLLTLGRVINALVDKSSHIPYRESKLTRLLQDSLGGRTKTCIIATVSPAKSNLEETISTLDYAFRAKNIRNKPQVNQLVNKKTLLKEFTAEIEKLKNELIATRQRNGVYLTTEGFEAITVESESRRILSEEQAAKIETIETNLRNKVQELFAITSNFLNLKKDHEGIKLTLDDTKSVLEQTEFVLSTTRQSLAEEAALRKAHQETEEKLGFVGNELISTLNQTVEDVGGLRKKIRRKSDLQDVNRSNWAKSQAQVSDVTSLVESRIQEFRTQQIELMATVSGRMQSFVDEELGKLSGTQRFLEENVALFGASEKEVSQQTSEAKEQMDNALEEIKTLREDVKTRVGEGLQGLSTAAERISAEVISELGAFHTHLHGSYSSLGREFKTMFDDLVKHINVQRVEANILREQLLLANNAAAEAKTHANGRLEAVLAEEREQAVQDRQNLLSQITSLINAQGKAQDSRLTSNIESVKNEIDESKNVFDDATSTYSESMNAWNVKEDRLVEEVMKSRETLKAKLKDDWMLANKHNATLQNSTKSVHDETIRIVDEQMKEISVQMQALDDFVARARSQNAKHHDDHAHSLQNLSSTVKTSYGNISEHFTFSYGRVKDLGEEMSSRTAILQEALSPLDTDLRVPLFELRTHISNTALEEYVPTGETPQKIQYHYPTTLPRTESHDALLSAIRRPGTSFAISSTPTSSAPASPNKPQVFHDESPIESTSPVSEPQEKPTLGLREVDVNINAGARHSETAVSTLIAKGSSEDTAPPLKRAATASSGLKMPNKLVRKTTSVVALEGRENNMPQSQMPVFAQSTGRRRSPRHG